MEPPTIIHTYSKPPCETFWRVFYVIVLLVGILIGASFAIAPIYLFLKHQNEWLLTLFIFIPSGSWMAYRMFHHLRKLMWEDSHLSSYTL